MPVDFGHYGFEIMKTIRAFSRDQQAQVYFGRRPHTQAVLSNLELFFVNRNLYVVYRIPCFVQEVTAVCQGAYIIDVISSAG